MTTQEPLEVGIDEKGLERRTLTLSGPLEGRPYRVTDFEVGITAITGGNFHQHVLALGAQAKNQEWQLVVKSDEVRDKLLSAGEIEVKNRVFKVRSSCRGHYRVRVHWLAPYISHNTLVSALTRFGEIHSVSYEKYSIDGFQNVATGVRTLVMSGDRRNLPHIMTIVGEEGERSEILITVAGRPPLCLKCRFVGHYRRECDTPYCRHCRAYGHLTEKCAVEGTYASKLKGNKGRDQTEDCMIVEEEVEQLSGEAKKAWEAWDKEYDIMEENVWQKEKQQAEKAEREEEKKVKSTPLTMRQAWGIANKELERLEQEKNEEVKRTKNRKPVKVTQVSQGSTPEEPLPSEGGAVATPPAERIEVTLGREDPVTEAGDIPPNVTTDPLTAEGLLPEAREILPMMERIEDSSAGESNPLTFAGDGNPQRERIEGCSPTSVDASGSVPNNCSETPPPEDGDRRWEIVTRKRKVRTHSSSPRRSPARSHMSRLEIAESESEEKVKTSSIKKKCTDND